MANPNPGYIGGIKLRPGAVRPSIPYANIPNAFFKSPEEYPDPAYPEEFPYLYDEHTDPCQWLGDSCEVKFNDDPSGAGDNSSALYEFRVDFPYVHAGKVMPDVRMGSWVYTMGFANGALDCVGDFTKRSYESKLNPLVGYYRPHPFTNAWIPDNAGSLGEMEQLVEISEAWITASVARIQKTFPPPDDDGTYFNAGELCELNARQMQARRAFNRRFKAQQTSKRRI